MDTDSTVLLVLYEPFLEPNDWRDGPNAPPCAHGTQVYLACPLCAAAPGGLPSARFLPVRWTKSGLHIVDRDPHDCLGMQD